MTIWFCSDWHLWHENIIRYCNRPFKDAVEMTHRIRDIHNSYVKPSDHYYNLGDVCMGRDSRGDELEIVPEFNGHGRLIMGNHDHYHIKHYARVFEKVMAMWMIDNIRFTHIPIHTGSMGWAEANVHGHIHDQDSPQPVVTKDGKVQPYVNICVERTEYRPISLEEVKDRIKLAKESYGKSATVRVEDSPVREPSAESNGC